MISFGPVPSRRLGKSLGINNIISPKVCSYGCIYCQVGETRNKSRSRVSFFEPEIIFQNVEKHLLKLDEKSYPDYLTFVSNGEPTLDINLGRSITALKSFGLPVAVITNASLLYDDCVREDLGIADWVSLKVDAADNRTWQIINRPAPDLDYDNTIKNLTLFAGGYKGILCTETMLVSGINDSPESVLKLAEIIREVNPGKAYLAIPTRPPSLSIVHPPGNEALTHAWQTFTDSGIVTELLIGFEGTDTGHTGNIYDDILNITAVHPLREDSLLELLNRDNADPMVVSSLTGQKLIRSVFYNGHKYYIREYHTDK